MKALLINGSPRKNGNTHSIMNLYKEVLPKHLNISETEIVYISLADQSIQPCKGCRACMEHCEDQCPCKDDVARIEEQMNSADVIIIGAPVYVEDISGLSKNWIDRMAYHCHRPFLSGKRVYLFTTSGANTSKHALITLRRAFLAWGACVIDEKNFSMGAKMADADVKTNFLKTIDEQLCGYEKAKGKIPLFSLISFQVQKGFWVKNGTESYDYDYWEAKGWLKKTSQYYYPLKIGFIKNIIVKAMGLLVGKILY